MTLREMEDFNDQEKPFHLNIAIPWFAVIGFVIVVLLGVVFSYLTRISHPPKYKSTLVSKMCRKYVPTEILEFEMKALSEEQENKTLLVH